VSDQARYINPHPYPVMIADLRRHPKRTEMPLTVFPFALHGDPNVLTVVEGPQ
jgi:hypothetical protein